ncbi:serine/threonine-protein kinase [Nocardia sp. BMG51109]|uniref:serine/threonine-protein kinase n=1 Tax=Nocardia sp. BMG51109 TaxID=1056816 RepID=UPI0004633427|nr:serine/threonine-protein kinase [Nocardia sp. BMG51109]
MERLKDADPKRLGTVTLRGRLGRGGMGTVYFGVTDDGEAVAVKVIRDDLADRADIHARFVREMDALRSVSSPHLAALLASSEDSDERPWMALEYIRGLSLKEYLDAHGPLTVEQTATLGLLIAKALADIHAAGLLHRDLKPGNILMGPEGPKVIDLGLVALAEGPTDLTSSGIPLGTVVCMSPEQVDSPKQVSAATDIYGLGATLLYSLARHFPYEAPAGPMLMLKISNPTIPPDLGGVPDPFVPILQRMVASDPIARPTITEVHNLLERLIGGQLPASIRNLAVTTYVERESDPEDPTPQQRPARKDLSHVAPPGSVIHRLAERLRKNYAATARF